MVAGQFGGEATFGSGEAGQTVLTCSTGWDVFVASYDDAGTLRWARSDGGTGADLGTGIASLADGGAIVTGSFEGTATFGLGEAHETALTSSGTGDVFLARYDAGGRLVWARSDGGIGIDRATAVAVAPDGAVFVTGSFKGTMTFGAGEATHVTLTAAGAEDIFVAKYDASGDFLWARRAGGPDPDSGVGVACTPGGDAVVAGEFEGRATFGSGEPHEATLGSAGGRDVFVATYGASGGLLWSQRAGGTGMDTCGAAATTPDGSAIVTGGFEGQAFFAPGSAEETMLAAGGGEDAFVCMYDASGALAWAKRAGGPDREGGHGVGPASDGGAIVTGMFGGRATFGSGEPRETTLTASGRYDMFVARYAR